MNRKIVIALDLQQCELILNALNQVCQGVQAAAQVLPVFAEVEKQVKAQIQEKSAE